jgi:hypothetical protein
VRFSAQTSPEKKTFRAAERERPDVKEKEKLFLEKIAQIDPSKIHFYDETSTKLNMTRSHARSIAGTRAKAARSAACHKNITLLGLIGPKSVKSLYPYDGFLNAEK